MTDTKKIVIRGGERDGRTFDLRSSATDVFELTHLGISEDFLEDESGGFVAYEKTLYIATGEFEDDREVFREE